MSDRRQWTLDDALPLIRQIEMICPEYGCHVALTGGTLYKMGPRKDLDLLFYRIRGQSIDEQGLLDALERLGVVFTTHYGWVTKATYGDRTIDLFFPDRADDWGYDRRIGPIEVLDEVPI
jgi:hypothetical protein